MNENEMPMTYNDYDCDTVTLQLELHPKKAREELFSFGAKSRGSGILPL